MTRTKRLLLCAIIFIIPLSLAMPSLVEADEPENLTLLEGVNTQYYELQLFPTGADPIDFNLPDVVWCTHTYNRFSVKCEVEWDITGTDTSGPGWISVTGTVIPPQGYRIAEGFAAYYPIMLIKDGMEKEPLAEVFIDDQFFLVGRDTALTDPLLLEDVFERTLPEEITYVTQNKLYGKAPIFWDTSEVDMKAAGRYPIHGIMNLPICFDLPENVSLSASNIQVMESDRIDLSGFKMDNSMNRVGSCRWIYTAEDIENITLEYAVGDADWQEAEAERSGSEMQAEEISCRYGENWLTIQFSALEDGEYYFRLIYQGEVSNILHVVVDKNAAVEWDIGGDRAGADQGSQKPPDIKQPDPTARNKNKGSAGSPTVQITGDNIISAAPDMIPQVLPDQTEREDSLTPVDVNSDAEAQGSVGEALQDDTMMEYSTANTLSISGLRLKEMLSLAGDTILFEKQGVSVELPADFLAGLEIADNSRFTVYIERGENAFTLEILRDEVPLSDLPETTVYVPFILADGADRDRLACFDAREQEVSEAVYDATLQVVRVEILATGSYTIAERGAAVLPAPAQKPVDRLMFAAIGLVAVGICTGCILLRRRHRSEAGGNG